MERLYFALWFRLNNRDAYLIWYTDDRDGVVVDDANMLPAFPDVLALQNWVQAQGLPFKQENPILHDLDVVQDWLNSPEPQNVNCAAILAAWNLFIDVQATLEDRNILEEGLEDSDLYDKLFWGNNLPSMTPPGEHYVPVWDDEELGRLQKVLREGLSRFQAHVRYVENEAISPG